MLDNIYTFCAKLNNHNYGTLLHDIMTQYYKIHDTILQDSKLSLFFATFAINLNIIMAQGSINSIIEAVLTPHNFFKTLTDFSVVTHVNGDVMFYPSNFAITVKVLIDDKYYALKCYTSQNDLRHEHFSELEKFFKLNNRHYFVDFQFLANEITLYDSDEVLYYDALLTQWIDGKTLHNEISEAVHHGQVKNISLLKSKFIELVKDFAVIGFAHGDLKPQNIIFEDKTQSLKVIDYDASWIKSISHLNNREVGTYWYQHPQRDSKHWNNNADNYSIVLITISLIATEKYLYLFERHNNKENIIFSPDEIINERSIPYKELQALWKKESTLITFLLSLKSITPYANNIMTFINEVKNYESKSQIIDSSQIIDNEGEYRRYYDEFGLYGYVDSDSNIALYAQWNNATTFEHGHAVVRSNGISYFVYDNCQVSTVGFDKIITYNSTHAIVMCANKYGIVNLLDYNFILKPKYDNVTLFVNGIAAVSISGKYFLMNEMSKRISKNTYDYCNIYDNGYCIAMHNGEYWVMDISENIVSNKTTQKLLYIKDGYLHRCVDNKIVKINLEQLEQNIFLSL